MLVDHAPFGVHQYDLKPDNRLILTGANQAADKILGISHSSLIGLTIEAAFPPLKETPIPEAYRSVARTGVPYEQETVNYEDETISGSFQIQAFQTDKNRMLVFFRDITERKKVEIALLKANRNWQSTFDSSSDGICVLDADQRVLQCNRAMADLAGLASGELMGRPCWEIVHGTKGPVPECPVLRMSKSLSREEMELAIGDRWFQIIVDPILDENKTLQGAVHQMRDISEQKRTEEALRRSEVRFRKLFEESPMPMALSGLDQRIFKINAAFQTMFGYSIEDLANITFRDYTHPDDLNLNIEGMRKLTAGETPVYRATKRYFRKDGALIWGELASIAVRDESEALLHYLVVIDDITERKKAENALAAEKERLAVTLRSIGDGVIATGTDGRVVLMNRMAEDLTGWTSAEAEGRLVGEVFNIINEKTRERCENPVEKVLKSGGIIGLANHTALIARSGAQRIIADSGAPIRDKESRIIGVVLVFRDITDKQRLEENMMKSQRLESLGLLAGGIAHDFNNLLSGIFGYMSIARDQAQKGNGDRAVNTLSKAMNVFERAKNLTQQLLTFAKGGAPVKQTLNLVGIVTNAAQFALSGSNVRHEFDFPPDLYMVDADENQLAQVIDNLIINAQHAMPTGGLIQIRAENVSPDLPLPGALKPGPYVKLSIKDQGTGIAREHLSRIFDPFFTTKQRGSGLGLATAYSIINRHDGLLDVESELGKGATFFVYLPASSKSAFTGPGGPAKDFRGEGRILVMDDEEFIKEIAGDLLKDMGFTVVHASDGKEAVDLFAQVMGTPSAFILVILDLTIPGGMGGRETMSKLLKIDPRVRAIASSGYSEDPVMARPREFGFKAGLVKPYRREELIEALRKVL